MISSLPVALRFPNQASSKPAFVAFAAPPSGRRSASPAEPRSLASCAFSSDRVPMNGTPDKMAGAGGKVKNRRPEPPPKTAYRGPAPIRLDLIRRRTLLSRPSDSCGSHDRARAVRAHGEDARERRERAVQIAQTILALQKSPLFRDAFLTLPEVRELLES